MYIYSLRRVHGKIHDGIRKMLIQCQQSSEAGFELKCEETLNIDCAHVET